MANPWPLSLASQDVVPLYYSWAAKNYSLFNNSKALCNWFPLRVLIEFAAANGVPVRLDYWPGKAPTKGKRFWDTSTRKILDSHDGSFATKSAYLVRAQSTVTARMIGSMNSVAIETTAAQPGDLICRDYSDSYWHVELITGTNGGKITAQSGSVPAIAPSQHSGTYRDLSNSDSVYQGKPRRWEFEEIFARPK